MNKRTYRVIFNRRRGLTMAVAEHVSAGGGTAAAAKRQPDPATPTPRPLRLVTSLALALPFALAVPAHAQIIADPAAAAARKPLVESTASGLPLVRIAPPSAAGVSHNQYSQFSIGTGGAVLNNATRITTTQLAGHVDGNPNLAGGPARIILNEVTGTVPSALRGYAEVAGQRAEVIIANPNGISCNGCGFINTSRGVLTTGVPGIGQNGSLDTLRVRRGAIAIEGDGLNGSAQDSVELIARSIRIDGAVQARNLQLLAGANIVGYANLALQVIEGDGGKPALAIDVSQLGGMYAERIRLVGTEAGVGVNHGGIMAARAGGLAIDSAGKLTLGGDARSDGSLLLDAADGLDNAGRLYSARDASLTSSGGGIANSGSIAAGGDLKLRGASIASSGALGAGVNEDGAVGSGGLLDIGADGMLAATGRNSAGSRIRMQGAALDLAGAVTTAADDIGLKATQGGINLSGGRTIATGHVGIDAAGLVRNDAGATQPAIVEAERLDMRAGALSNRGGLIRQTGATAQAITVDTLLDNSGGSIQSGTATLRIDASGLVNDGGGILANGATTLAMTGAASNRSGSIAAARLDLDAASLDNGSGTIEAGGALRIGVAGLLQNTGTTPDGKPAGIHGDGGTSIQAGALRNDGAITANDALAIVARQDLDNRKGTIAATGALDMKAGAGFDNRSGRVGAQGVSIAAATIDNRAGLIRDSGATGTALQADARFDNGGGAVESAGANLALRAASLNNDEGAIRHAGAGKLAIESGELSNAAGHIAGNGDVTLAATTLANAGDITAQGRLRTQAGTLNNDGGMLASNGALELDAGTLSNRSGSISAGSAMEASSVRIDAERIDNAAGAINAGSLALYADSLGNAHGTITQTDAAGSARLDIRENLDNRDGTIGAAASDLRLAPAGQLQNDGGRIIHAGAGKLAIASGSLGNANGDIGGNGAVEIRAGVIDNRGGTMSGAMLDAQAGNGIDNRGGRLLAGAVRIDAGAGTLDNRAGSILGLGHEASSISAQADIDNRGGIIGARGELTVSASGIANAAGTISADGRGILRAERDIDNAAGTLQAAGDLELNAGGSFVNIDGRARALGAQSRMDIAADVIDNRGGRIMNAGAGDTALRAATRLLNANAQAQANAGVIGGNGRVRVNAQRLDNLQGGMLMALGDLRLHVTQRLDNSGAKLMAGGKLELRQPGLALANIAGDISAGDIRIDADAIDNSRGRIASVGAGAGDGNGNIGIEAHSLNNAGGDIASALDLALRTGRLDGAGRIFGARDVDLTLDGDHDNPAGNLLHANRDLRASVAGQLGNAGTIEAAGNLTLNAAGIDNRAGGVIASGSPDAPGTGHTLLNAPNGVLANAGRIEGNFLETHSTSLVNTGAMLGDHVAISAGDIANTGTDAIIAAVGQLDLWGRFIANRDGATLYSLGDIRIAADGALDAAGELIHRADRIDNLSSTIEANGQLRVAADTVNNTGPTLRTVTTTVGDATWTLKQLPWWSSAAPGIGKPERNANTIRLDAYYLPPEAILSDIPLITPDGYVIHKAVVSLSERDSAFQLMEGGVAPRDALYRLTSIEYGSQSRLQATSGTRVLYYLSRQDKQSNPDQVAGPGAWSAHEAASGNVPILNPLGTITYSGDYGRCSSNCVRLEALPGYDDPTQYLLKTEERRRPGGPAPGVYPVEVRRIAHQTVTETRVEAVDARSPALMASGGAMSFNISQALNNDNSRIAAGGELFINGAASDGGNNALVRNSAIILTRTYTFANRSGYGDASIDNAPPVEWVDWINTPIEQKIGTVGGTISSNAALRIDARSIVNNSVRAAPGPAGASPQALGLEESIAPLAGSAWGRQSLSASDAKPIAPTPRGAPIAIEAAVPRVVDGARAGIVAAPLPTNGLYRIAPEPAKPYLVQTDARFTSYANFLSSDWMLRRLGIDPDQTQKRLGDGFYEQRLLQNQVTGLTGKRFLAGYASAEEEYLALMTNGLEYAQRFGLEPGIALTDAQMAALTSNMIWLVSETVTLPDGSRQTVLAPQLYLAKNAALTPTGALIDGESVAIRTGDLDNTGGTVRGAILNAIAADGAIVNDGGSLLGGDIAIRARSISNASLVETHSTAGRDGVSMVSGVSALSRIEATGNMLIDVEGAFSARGARIAAGKSGSLVAGSVSITGVQTSAVFSDAHGKLGADPVPELPFGWALFPSAGVLASGSLNSAQGSRYASASTQNFGSTLSAGGSFSVFSKGSLDFLGSQASAGKSLTLAAAGPVTIGAEMGSISMQAKVRVPKYTYQESMQADTASGSTLRAGGDIRVLAGAQRDADGTIRFDPKAGNPNASLTVAGSSVQAGLDANGQGAAMLGSTGALNVDPTFLAGSYREESRQVIERRLSSEKDHDLREGSGTGAIGSAISGNTVFMASGKDMRIAGASVGATGNVTLAAGGDIDIAAARTSETRHTLQEKNQSGIMTSGGGLLVGSRDQRDEANANGTFDSRLRSMVGSSQGKVGIAAKGDVRIAGSDVVAGDRIDVIGRNVTITPGEDEVHSRETHDLRQSGVTVTVGGAIPNAARAAAAAVDRSANNGDARIAALQAAKAGMTIANYANAVDAAAAANAAAGADVAKAPTGFKVAIGVGSSRSHSETTSSNESSTGSNLASLNGISILATGSGAKNADGSPADGDIRIAGSQLTSRDIDLAAARDLQLEAVADRYSSHSKNTASSASIGVGFAVGGNQNGITVELAASTSRGRANTDSTTYQQTGVNASGTLSLASGRDTTVVGAQLSGETVRADVGRNLSITSTQDTQTVDIKQESAGFNASVCVPPICYGAAVEGSASVGTSTTSGNYISVRQQSGIFAGTGGFDITVRGNTELTGAALGSKADADRNSFTTGTLVTRDLENRVEYEGGSFGVTASTGADSKDSRLQGPVGVTPSIGVGASGSQAGVTKSAIAAGTVRIADEAGQMAATGKSTEDTIATLNRDVANANKTVDRLPDLQKLQQQQQLAQLIGEVGNQGIGMLSQKMGYADGSAEKIALHSVLGYVQAQAAGGNSLAGATAGAAGEWIGTKVDEYLRSNPSLTDNQRKAIQQWSATAVGGLVGGVVGRTGGAQAGAAVGLDAERYNRQLHPAVKPFISELAKKQTRFTEQELQQAARVVLANDRIGDGTRTSYASEAEANAAGVGKVTLGPDGKYYEVVAASPEAVQYVTAQLRTGPAEIQNEFMAAQFDRIKFDAKPRYTEAQNAGIDMLVTSPAMGSNAPPATVGATGVLPVKAGSGLTNGESFNNGVKNSTIGTKVVIEPKIEKQISSRGWTVDSIVETVSKPSETLATKDTRFDPTTGFRKNDPATAYFNTDGSYVVVSNKDQTVVQVSDRTDPNWKSPWNTKND